MSSPGQTKGAYGTDYSDAPEEPYEIPCDGRTIVEVPLTVRRTRSFIPSSASGVKPLAKSMLNVVCGQALQLRPNGKNLNEMLWLERYIAKGPSNYIMFMLHSSEFMPGGSPTFKDAKAIEGLYAHLEKLFEQASRDFEGETIGTFARRLAVNDSLGGKR